MVYLLHGAYGDNSSWVRFSNIERYAQAHNIVAVMASVENSLYQDMVHGNKYFTFISEELPSFITTLFPVSKKREDTYICGFSMGGYGACSSVCPAPRSMARSQACLLPWISPGCRTKCRRATSKHRSPSTTSLRIRLIWLAATRISLSCIAAMQKRAVWPELYQACGTKDFLYQMNEDANRRLTEMGAKITYSVAPDAMHNWDYWDSELPKILDWMMQK